MMSIRIPAAGVMVCVAAALSHVSIGAQKAAKPTAPVPVSAEFRCPQLVDCVSVDRIEGDGLGPYFGDPNVQQGAYFDMNNHLYFPLRRGLGRFVSLDFSATLGTPSCASTNSCRKNFTTVFTDHSLPASITNPVDAVGESLPNGFYSLAVGQSAAAKYLLNFADPSGRALRWSVRFNPPAYPGSSYVTVTRTGTSSWSIEATASDVAELVSTPTSGRAVTVHEGFYAMPFKISVTQ